MAKPTREEIEDFAVEASCSDSDGGMCLACGETRDGCEPDARNYLCDCCGECEVFGGQELLIMFVG